MRRSLYCLLFCRCVHIFIQIVGTSAIIDSEIDGAVGMNSGIFNNPFMIWGRYRRKAFRYYLPVSFQFHHTQMDGAHAGRFLRNLQDEINRLYKCCPCRFL